MGKIQKSVILIDTSKCTSCAGLICVGVCPQGVFEEGQNRKPQIVDVVECTLCGVCVNLCPAKAITISKP
ncbi:MAG TPA: 4Fe-4S dicluster domain-containing protein [Candidatus Bathyarchaeia archaeon]|nr:4Fe-4S dicluster domain-containing protein [Candidatus Bathyarchaeia archaeon]